MKLVKTDETHASDWDDKTPVRNASMKEVALLAADVRSLRRGLRTSWILSILCFVGLLASLVVMTNNENLSKEDIVQILDNERTQRLERLLFELIEKYPLSDD